MKVLFYGRLADAIEPELELDNSVGCSVADLRDRLIVDHPGAGQSLRDKRARACVGDTLVDDSYRLSAGDTVEFLPPVSGG